MPSAFEQIASRHRDRIYTFACYWLGDRDDAEDVTQEVLVRLWRHWESLDDAKQGPWVIHVTRNLCIDALRRRQTVRRLVASDPEGLVMDRVASPVPGPAALAETADFTSRVQDALRDLPEPYRTIVILREIQDLKYEEIGAAMDMPLNTVKVYLHRGRRKLRERLKEWVGDATA